MILEEKEAQEILKSYRLSKISLLTITIWFYETTPSCRKRKKF
jgi:hypothetical protein